MLGLVSLLLGVQQHLYLGSQIAFARDSALWLMPRLNIVNGRAEAESVGPRTLSTERFVVYIDTGPDRELPKASPGDTRPRYLVFREALVVVTIDQPRGSALGWAQLNALFGSISVDGPELIQAAERALLKMVLVVAVLRALAALFAILVGAGVVALVYRALFFARRLPPARGQRAIAVLAGVPAVAVVGVVSLIGGSRGMVDPGVLFFEATVLAVVGVTVFFVAAAGIDAEEPPSV
jgi:hypothetical protein